MAGDVVLKLDADIAQYIAKMSKAQAATERTAKSAGGIGDEFVKGMAKVEVFKRAIEAAGRAVSGVLDKSAEASRRGGQFSLTATAALAPMGVRDIERTITQMRTGQGASTPDQRLAFAQGLQGMNAGRAAPMREEQVLQALEAYQQGGDILYGAGGKELISGLEKGFSLAEIKRRAIRSRPGLNAVLNTPTGTVATELGIQSLESSSAVTNEAARRNAGLQVRAGAAANEETAASNRAADIFRNIMPDAVNSGFDAARGLEGMNELRESVDIQTSIMRRELTRPNLNTTTGDP